MDITVATPEPVEPVVILTLTMAEAQRLSAASYLLEAGLQEPRLWVLLENAGVPCPLAPGGIIGASARSALQSAIREDGWLVATDNDRIGG